VSDCGWREAVGTGVGGVGIDTDGAEMSQVAEASRIRASGGTPLLRVIVGLAGVCSVGLHAQYPAWWTERGVVSTNAPVSTNDFAAINQGQLKQVAAKASEELEARLPGGAGSNVLLMIGGWATPGSNVNDYAGANLGQIKAVAAPFYDRFDELGILTNGYPWTIGLSNGYPWTGGSNASDFALANIGQVKRAFAFDLTSWNSDADHLPDTWEQAHFGPGNLSQGDADDPDGDAVSNLQEYLNQSDPADYYNGQAVCVFVVSGDRQDGQTNSYLDQALVVGVSNAFGALTNAPVSFEVAAGDGLLGLATNGAGLAVCITGRTDVSGLAGVWLQYGSDAFLTNEVRILAGPPALTAETNMLAFLNEPPQIAWNTPTDGASFAPGVAVFLQASAIDDECVAKVQFFADDTELGEDTAAPYVLTWSNSVVGTHALWAKAIDNRGAWATSTPVAIWITPPDGDGDGMADAWEIQWLGGTNAAPAGDFDGDGLSNLQEFEEGTLPDDFYNGRRPLLSIVSGDRQAANTNTFLPEPLVVCARDQSGLSLSNAPVTFTISPTGGLFSTNTVGAPLLATNTVRADENGVAQVWLKLPPVGGLQLITASAFDTNVLLQAFAKSAANRPTVTVEATDPVSAEPGSNIGVFTISHNGNTFSSLPVVFGMSGTATNGTDYATITSPATIPAGTNWVRVEVRPLDNTNVEPTETAILTLSNNAAYVVGSPSVATNSILDNEKTGTTSIDGGENFSTVLMSDGTVWTFGADSSGQLGNGNGGATNVPVQVPSLSNVIQVACGQYHCLALQIGGRIKSWGEGDDGRLGDNNSQDRQSPVFVVNSGLTNAIAISGGEHHSMAIASNGAVWAWGSTEEGGLGIGPNEENSYDTPQATTITSAATQISAGRRASYALQVTTLKGAGHNKSGGTGPCQLADSTIANSPTFITVTSPAVSMAAGYEFGLTLRTDGKVYAWGDNGDAQLGVSHDGGGVDYRYTVEVIAGVSNVSAIAAGRGHSLALRANGTVWAWGRGEEGQLGDGSTSERVSPVQATATGFSNAIAIAAGYYHSLAITADGSVWTWGKNSSGQLGLGTNDQRRTRPTRIPGFNVFDRLPTVSIAWPTNSVATDPSGNLVIQADASDSDGTVAKVEFFRDDEKIGESLSSPFGFSWTNATLGACMLTAVATDDKGLSATSAPVAVTVYSGGDSDGDGLSDYEEVVVHGTNPLLKDSNGDGLLDGAAVLAGFDPMEADPDQDGVPTTAELTAGTNPFRADTDGDGHNDGADAFPLDPSRHAALADDPGDDTPPTINLDRPADAQPLP